MPPLQPECLFRCFDVDRRDDDDDDDDDEEDEYDDADDKERDLDNNS